jgi:CHASE2 domain-containing sensor protein
MSPSVSRALPFLVALTLSGMLAASLLAAHMGGSWSLVGASAAFVAFGTGFLRLQQRHQHRH